MIKVRKFQNELIKSSFLPKYEPNIVRIYACTVPHYRAEILTIFGSYFRRNDEFINSFWNLLTFSTLAIFGIPRPLVIQVEISDVIDLRYAYLHGPSMWKLQPSSVLISQAKI